MKQARRAFMVLALAGLLATPAGAQNRKRSQDPDIARLEKELAEQRQMLINILQSEQQRYEMLLKMVTSGKLPSGGLSSPGFDPPSGGDERTTSRPRPSQPSRPAPAATATIEGRVNMKGSKPAAAYVYVENVGGSSASGTTFEVKQENKQFYPRVSVVQRGTRLVFPNLDTIFHNVFSVSPGNTFDLGTYRAGDKARSVVVTSPGVVEIFCNMHSRMSASVLVVPNGLFTKVNADGSFKINNVPLGARKVVAWAPNAKPVARDVDVSPNGGETDFTLEVNDRNSHSNKFGQPYGSYED
jgi:plastocyanin